MNKEKIKEFRQKKKSPEVILKFLPDPNFEKEFLDFVQKVLNWKENADEKQKVNNKKDERK
ncbi:MAG: hypothetical protein ABIK66_06150 [candidate division WOR-3 bacterium]